MVKMMKREKLSETKTAKKGDALADELNFDEHAMDIQDLSNSDSVFWHYLFAAAVAVEGGTVFGIEMSPVMMAVGIVEEMYWDITKAKVC